MRTENGVRALLAAGVQQRLVRPDDLAAELARLEPSRQALRRDSAGRVRWLDACWERARVVAEIDGLWHMDAVAWWADMRRDNDLTISGYLVLRFPAFAVREHPDLVAAQIASALRRRGQTW